MQIDVGMASLVLGVLLTGINLFKELRRPSLERDKETKEYRRFIESEIARLQGDVEDLKTASSDHDRRLNAAENILSDLLEGVVRLSRHAVDGNHVDQLSEYADRVEKRLYKRSQP